MDFSGSRRRGSVPKVGPVWETTMKLGKVRGGIKVLHPNDDTFKGNSITICSSGVSSLNSGEFQVDESKMRSKQSLAGKKRAKKSEDCEVSPVEETRQGSEVKKQWKRMNDGIKKALTLPASHKGGNGIHNDDSVQLRKVKSEPIKNLDPNEGGDEKSRNCDDQEGVNEPDADLGKSPVGIMWPRSDEACKELGVCQEIAISNNLGNGKYDSEEEEEVVVIQDKELVLRNERQLPISPIAKKEDSLPPNPAKAKPMQSPDHSYGTQTPQTKLQNLSDLIMWRDVSKSSLVFGIGAFAIVSSSYTWEIHVSFISVLSYIGLVYLGAVFLFRSLICRGIDPLDEAKQDYVVGEEDAVRMIKLVLPYLNEFLLNFRALFSGDPPTTMKLAVFLFILARCGGSITIWKLAKLGFVGIFTVPKVCSAYSPHLASFVTFWIERLGDVWRSCSHKKAIGFGTFTLIWNISSIVARIWTLFMLFVAFKCYQQCSIKYLRELQDEEEDIPENKSKLVERNGKINYGH